MKRVAHIVDSHVYVETNCYQHQLQRALRDTADATTIAIGDLITRTPGALEAVMAADVVVLCLKLRTLADRCMQLRPILRGKVVTVYEQDPWESYKMDSPHCGSYERISNFLDVKKYVVTARWWAAHMRRCGLPAEFARIWVLPEYCSAPPPFELRKNRVGFIGSVHPHRRALFEHVEKLGVRVNIEHGTYAYREFLTRLSGIGVFMHSADLPFEAYEPDGLHTFDSNHSLGLWAKDVEAAARGCFSVREASSESASFIDHEHMKTVMLFEHRDQVPDIVQAIEKMDPEERHRMQCETVGHIRAMNYWDETARVVIDELTSPRG